MAVASHGALTDALEQSGNEDPLSMNYRCWGQRRSHQHQHAQVQQRRPVAPRSRLRCQLVVFSLLLASPRLLSATTPKKMQMQPKEQSESELMPGWKPKHWESRLASRLSQASHERVGVTFSDRLGGALTKVLGVFATPAESLCRPRVAADTSSNEQSAWVAAIACNGRAIERRCEHSGCIAPSHTAVDRAQASVDRCCQGTGTDTGTACGPSLAGHSHEQHGMSRYAVERVRAADALRADVDCTVLPASAQASDGTDDVLLMQRDVTVEAADEAVANDDPVLDLAFDSDDLPHVVQSEPGTQYSIDFIVARLWQIMPPGVSEGVVQVNANLVFEQLTDIYLMGLRMDTIAERIGRIRSLLTSDTIQLRLNMDDQPDVISVPGHNHGYSEEEILQAIVDLQQRYPEVLRNAPSNYLADVASRVTRFREELDRRMHVAWQFVEQASASSSGASSSGAIPSAFQPIAKRYMAMVWTHQHHLQHAQRRLSTALKLNHISGGLCTSAIGVCQRAVAHKLQMLTTVEQLAHEEVPNFKYDEAVGEAAAHLEGTTAHLPTDWLCQGASTDLCDPNQSTSSEASSAPICCSNCLTPVTLAYDHQLCVGCFNAQAAAALTSKPSPVVLQSAESELESDPYSPEVADDPDDNV